MVRDSVPKNLATPPARPSRTRRHASPRPWKLQTESQANGEYSEWFTIETKISRTLRRTYETYPRKAGRAQERFERSRGHRRGSHGPAGLAAEIAGQGKRRR